MIKDEFILIDEVKSGIDYENFCFQQLKNAGYQVSKTPEIGDQGVDLIVSANNKKCAIQCKYYSTPVGNKAVQEVIAGRGFYNCELGMVCSNNTYTKSARELASNQHIVLVEKNNIIQAVNRLLGPIRTPSSKKIAYRQNNVLREIENNNQKSIAEYYKNKKSANNRNNNH
ncbi:MAG: restriction endonuclease [Alphaproteobacteria bacterium]|nr:restriction endonuclease [Alphaproteobacteria bacterium]